MKIKFQTWPAKVPRKISRLLRNEVKFKVQHGKKLKTSVQLPHSKKKWRPLKEETEAPVSNLRLHFGLLIQNYSSNP